MTQLSPIPWLKKFQSLGFAGPRFGFEIVNPSHQRRKTHQNGFGSATRFKTENRAAIVEEIELDIAAAAIKLILTLLLADTAHSCVVVAMGTYASRKCVADLLNELEILVPVAFKVIEKKAADAAHFSAMFQREVFVAPLLELRIKARIVTIACCP